MDSSHFLYSIPSPRDQLVTCSVFLWCLLVGANQTPILQTWYLTEDLCHISYLVGNSAWSCFKHFIFYCGNVYCCGSYTCPSTPLQPNFTFIHYACTNTFKLTRFEFCLVTSLSFHSPARTTDLWEASQHVNEMQGNEQLMHECGCHSRLNRATT